MNADAFELTLGLKVKIMSPFAGANSVVVDITYPPAARTERNSFQMRTLYGCNWEISCNSG